MKWESANEANWPLAQVCNVQSPKIAKSENIVVGIIVRIDDSGEFLVTGSSFSRALGKRQKVRSALESPSLGGGAANSSRCCCEELLELGLFKSTRRSERQSRSNDQTDNMIVLAEKG